MVSFTGVNGRHGAHNAGHNAAHTAGHMDSLVMAPPGDVCLAHYYNVSPAQLAVTLSLTYRDTCKLQDFKNGRFLYLMTHFYP